MIQLTPQQTEAVAASGGSPPILVDPNTQTTYVLVRKDQARATLQPPQEWFEGDEPKPF